MHYSRIARKIRRQIRRFSGEVSRGLCKTARRFVAEAIYGIQARESVLLSEITRALNEEIPYKKTETRLSNQVNREGLGKEVEENLLSLASSRINEDTLLVVDISDISKRYARKMEHLARVRDGSTGATGPGYWTIQVIGTELGEVHVTPLLHRLYSQCAPGFDSENDEILKAVRSVSRAVDNRGIYLIDRGGDRRKLLYPFLNGKLRFIIRLVGNRHLVYRGKHVIASDLGTSCPMFYAERVVKEKEGKEKRYHIEYGFRKVRLPGRSELLTLVVIRGYGREPIMLLTNVEVKKSRSSCFFVAHAYIKRWHVEETIRCMKQSYDLENIRLLTYRRLQNMMSLVLCAMYFAAVYLGDRVKLGVLAHHALREAKRFFGIPDFRYYALVDGVKAILDGFKGPFLQKGQLNAQESQLCLFDP